jgi:hypothetical protein
MGRGPRFRLPSVDRFLRAWGDDLLRRLRACGKAPIGRAYEGGGHAQRHQSFALGIGADALGELYWLPD